MLDGRLFALHAIQTVFSVPSMRTDERFKNSPHVKEAGLQSYAGTSLIYEVPNSESVQFIHISRFSVNATLACMGL